MTSPVVVVLAAGRGTRFLGEHHKLEQPLDGMSVLAHTLNNVIVSQLPMVVVITSALASLARGLVASRDLLVLDASAPVGMGHSIAAGVSARPHANGWLMLPGDMPLVRPQTLRAVAAGVSQYPVVYAQHRGRRGHPVGFAAELFSELIMLEGDEGARRLVVRYPSHAIDVDDAGVLVDVDTQEDLQMLVASQAASKGMAAPP